MTSESKSKIVYSPQMNLDEIRKTTKDVYNKTISNLKEKSENNNDNMIDPKADIDNEISKEYFNWSESKLIDEILKYNQIEKLLLKGIYIPDKLGRNFGYFKGVKHLNSTYLNYPLSFGEIQSAFVFSNELIRSQEYIFEAKLAGMKIRKEKNNPFLIEADVSKLSQVKEHNELEKLIREKNNLLTELQKSLENTENELETRRSVIEVQIEKLQIEKTNEANKIIEEYNFSIQEKFDDIQKKGKELNSLNESVTETKSQLQKMENLISTLTERISLCRNLQFISEYDENKYLSILTAKEFQRENHLDFDKDFQKSFSELSEHIHGYLYHKKKLIYTQFQIKNFLTLLRTHDLIVLSGLSGSGKTQIVKAFAEALGGVAKIIPVKPNWTSSDDLIGYYNPLQMSFLPTPFTEAIVEAINNPNQLYFICLDEMNLARAEYYFADFLSKLEERSKEPEIELYAHHEEELFVSEFSTLLNLIETSIRGKEIKSWQEFLDNEEVRKKFFEMLGNTDKESMLQLHSKMKRRLIDILKFPSTIKIPDNVRFIGAINVDETTHYFSPKILDRIHVVKFDNPLLFEEQVNNWFENSKTEKELKPVYVKPNLFSERNEYPAINNYKQSFLTQILKELNLNFLVPLNIDFGIRSVRQALNFADCFGLVFFDETELIHDNPIDLDKYYEDEWCRQITILNAITIQKILPRFSFDGNETAKNGKLKITIVEELKNFLSDKFNKYCSNYESDNTNFGIASNKYLADMIDQANRNNSQFNFFA